MVARQRSKPAIIEPVPVPDVFFTGVRFGEIGGVTWITFYAERPAQWEGSGPSERVVVARLVCAEETKRRVMHHMTQWMNGRAVTHSAHTVVS